MTAKKHIAPSDEAELSKSVIHYCMERWESGTGRFGSKKRSLSFWWCISSSTLLSCFISGGEIKL